MMTRADPGRVLTCAECDLPAAYIRNGALVWQSRHHGEAHWNSVTPEQLTELLIGDVEWYAHNGKVYHACLPWSLRRSCEYDGGGVWRCVTCSKTWKTIP